MDITLQTALAEMVTQLATFFGTTTEAIMENAPSFLRSYGWYSTVKNLPGNILMFMLIAFIGSGMVILVYNMISVLTETNFNKKTLFKMVVGIVILFFIACVVTNFILCAISPEIVGLKALLAILK